MRCKNEFDEQNILSCTKTDIFHYWFKFNRGNKRYIFTSLDGYISGANNLGKTPYIEIGTCSRI